MTVEEMLEIKRRMRGSLYIENLTDWRKKEVEIDAEIITILKKHDLGYSSACYYLEDCLKVLKFIAKI